MKSKKGISLIVLIVTIIVIIILAAAVILTLNQNNPIDSSRIAQLADNRASLNSAVSLYYGKKMAETQGVYDTKEVLIYGNNLGDETKMNEGLRDFETAVGVNQLGYGDGENKSEQYYTLSTASLDVSLPNMAKATWYIDVNSGLVYLVYESVDDVPSWMFKDSTTMDSTLDEFVRLHNTTNHTLVNVTK